MDQKAILSLAGEANGLYIHGCEEYKHGRTGAKNLLTMKNTALSILALVKNNYKLSEGISVKREM